MQEKNEIEQETVKDNPEHLNKVKNIFVRQVTFSQGSKDRIETLMKRKSARKWNAKKVAKMVRRYTSALKTNQEASEIVDNIDYRLSQQQKTDT